MTEFTTQPKFYDILNEDDRQRYCTLRTTLSSNLCRNCRGKRLENFNEMLAAIKSFCMRGDDDDWKRCLVCGVCWLPVGIAINNRQFSLLISKCKSSINGSLQRMGFGTIQSRSESTKVLSDALPLLKDNFVELREWSVRQYVANTPQPTNPIVQKPPVLPEPFASPNPSLPTMPINPQTSWVPPSLSEPMLAQPDKDVPDLPPLNDDSLDPSFGKNGVIYGAPYLPGPDQGLGETPSINSPYIYEDEPDPYALEPSMFYDD